MPETKFRLKTSSLELEFEGEQAFLKEELLAIVDALLQQGVSAEDHDVPEQHPAGAETSLGVSTSTIAGRLAAQSGPDLILAACAHLTFVGNRDVFSRTEITADMKTATAYFKGTHLANLTKYLQGLVRSGKLIERSSGSYSLSASARNELEGKARES
jgi:hypothetical protein